MPSEGLPFVVGEYKTLIIMPIANRLICKHHAATPAIDSENIVGLRPHMNEIAGHSIRACKRL